MQAYLEEIDWDNFVLDSTAIHSFFDDFAIDYSNFSDDDWTYIFETLGVVEMPYDVHEIIGILETVGYDSSTVDQYTLYYILIEIDPDNFVLDNYALDYLWNNL
jgi:hypothetical protein